MKDKRKAFLRKAQRHERRGDIREALRCLERAQALPGEPPVGDRIARLKQGLSSREIRASARERELAGDFHAAAGLYNRARGPEPDIELALRRVACLVRAGELAEAAAALRAIDPGPVREMDPSSQYAYAFALAKTGRYHEALQVMDRLPSQDPAFLEQRAAIGLLLAASLPERLGRGEDCLEEARVLLRSSRGGPAAQRVRRAAIARLWEEERYEAAYEMLAPLTGPPAPQDVALRAKLCFRLAESSGKYLDQLAGFWLAALFAPGALENFVEDARDVELTRRELLNRAEGLLRALAESGQAQGRHALALWESERARVEEVASLAADRRDLWVCPPRFAREFGLADPILDLICKNPDSFPERESYLRAGAWYSSAMESLARLEAGDSAGAFAMLPKEPASKSEAVFVEYGAARVRFACALSCLERGQSQAGRHLRAAAPLFEAAPRYEEILMGKLQAADETVELARLETALRELLSRRSTPGLRRALSLASVRLALRQINDEEIDLQTCELSLRRALELDPGNELARGEIARMQADLRIEEMIGAFNRGRLGAAARIAAASGDPRVREEFFSGARDILRAADAEGPLGPEKAALIGALARACRTVDPTHPLVRMLESQADGRLEEVG